MTDFINENIRTVVLPDWLQECDDFCDSCLTKPTPRGKAADMWIEHGCDMILKIRQLMAENATLRQHLAAVCEAVRDLINNSRGVIGLHLNGDEASWDELLPGGRFEQWLLSLETAEAYLDSTSEKGKENPT